MQMCGNSNFNETRADTEFVRFVQIEFMVQLNTTIYKAVGLKVVLNVARH